jgi:hypothetical protein
MSEFYHLAAVLFLAGMGVLMVWFVTLIIKETWPWF